MDLIFKFFHEYEQVFWALINAYLFFEFIRLRMEKARLRMEKARLRNIDPLIQLIIDLVDDKNAQKDTEAWLKSLGINSPEDIEIIGNIARISETLKTYKKG